MSSRDSVGRIDLGQLPPGRKQLLGEIASAAVRPGESGQSPDRRTDSPQEYAIGEPRVDRPIQHRTLCRRSPPNWSCGPPASFELGGLLTGAVLLVNNYRDVDADARVGRRTLAIVAGPQFTTYSAFTRGSLRLAAAVYRSCSAAWSRVAGICRSAANAREAAYTDMSRAISPRRRRAFGYLPRRQSLAARAAEALLPLGPRTGASAIRSAHPETRARHGVPASCLC